MKSFHFMVGRAMQWVGLTLLPVGVVLENMGKIDFLGCLQMAMGGTLFFLIGRRIQGDPKEG